MKVGIIAASIRDGRLGERVVRWVQTEASKMDGWEVELLDLRELDLPLLTDARQPFDMGKDYPSARVTSWSQKVDEKDAFVIVTPEYNHGLPAPLKNALDWLYPEWNDKAAALVGYSNGIGGGIRSVEQLRLTLAHLGVATVQQVTSIARAQDNFSEDGQALNDHFNGSLVRALSQLDKWGRALNSIR